MGHTPSYSWRAKLFYWWTVSLCHIEANPVTTVGLCVSLFSCQRQRFLVLFRLLYVGWFVLPTIYEEMWTEILTEIKKKPSENRPPDCHVDYYYLHVVLLSASLRTKATVYHAACTRLEGVTWTWHWLRRHLSILAVCVCARVSVCACVRSVCVCWCVNVNIEGERVRDYILAESTGLICGCGSSVYGFKVA